MKAKFNFIKPGESSILGLIKTSFDALAIGHIGGNDDRLPAMLAECTGCALPLLQVVAPELSDRMCATTQKYIITSQYTIHQVIHASSSHTPEVSLASC